YYTLSIMSYNRYLVICYPLQYNTNMTYKKVATVVVLTWLFGFLQVSILISLSAPLKLCGNIINKVYCDNYTIVKLACFDTTTNNVYGLLITFITVYGPTILILYTYIRILKMFFSGFTQTRQKAVSTCSPHLVTLLTFSVGAFFEVVQNRFNMNSLPNMLHIFLSLDWLTCQPLINPVLYGLKVTKICIILWST
uniref:olfactory receptor 52N5-like n=1 Tax=Monopterus albus TaxID=43700 RepID=UPI0009B4681F